MARKREKGGAGNILTEAFNYIKPKGKGFKGIPAPPTIAIGTETGPQGASGANGASGADGASGPAGSTVSASLSAAGEQIKQLQQAYQQQAALITANTQALTTNTSGLAASLTSEAKSATTSIMGGSGIESILGGGGLIGDAIGAIAGIFGEGPKTPAPLPYYTPPPPVAISANIGSAAGQGTGAGGAVAQPPAAPPAAAPATTVVNVTIPVSAMDSQSIMDRSSDIADAVRSAMLNMHPINGVIQNL